MFRVLGGVDTGGEVGRRGGWSSEMLDTLMTAVPLGLLWLLEFERQTKFLFDTFSDVNLE